MIGDGRSNMSKTYSYAVICKSGLVRGVLIKPSIQYCNLSTAKVHHLIQGLIAKTDTCIKLGTWKRVQIYMIFMFYAPLMRLAKPFMTNRSRFMGSCFVP